MTYEVWQFYWMGGSPRQYRLATFEHRNDAILYADARAVEHETKNHGYEYRVYEAYTHINMIHSGGQDE